MEQTTPSLSGIAELLRLAFEAFRAKQYAESERLYREVLVLDPKHGVARHTLGVIAQLNGRNREAVDHMRQAVTRMAGDPAFFYNFGLMLQKQQKFDEAVKNYEEAVRLNPVYTAALNNLGSVLLIQGKLTEAEHYLRQAVATDERYYLSFNNLASALKDQGKYAEAIEHYRTALAIRPADEQSGSNLLLTFCYCGVLDKERLFDEHRLYESRMRSVAPVVAPTAPCRRRSGELLRIGYISPDFRTHSVAYFIEPVLGCHDHARFAIFCYSDGPIVDSVSLRLQKLCDRWVRIQGMDNDAVAARIAADQIDLLVDLTGHSGYNRLPLFIRRVAPVQVTYLGYPNTTGLSTMDYRLTDEISDPPGEERFHTERLYRLPAGFLCYRAPETSPDVAPLPALSNGYITFGSFNNLPKITLAVLDAWMAILRAVPDSRLVIKTKPFVDEAIRLRYQRIFTDQGIEPARLSFIGHTSTLGDHLKSYDAVDISLDTFPYNGTTTTFESLWMGVPVVTKVGNAHAGRVSASILTRLGLTGMIADSQEKYCAIARFLAGDRERLAKMRLNLRPALARSPMSDAAGFTRLLEEAYLTMWQEKVGDG
jgi:protein O-GlcNAc transferase